MPLPNFLCVGAQKAGTTTLYQVLKQHPDIYLPEIKEPHFFDEHYEKGVNWYEENFFSQYGKEKSIGEITPAYLYIDDVPQRIRDTLGEDVKLIFIFRNPADRAYSHYLMSKFNGFEKASFEEVMEAEQRSTHRKIAEERRFSYKNRGFYGKQLEKYLEVFPKSNMLFLLFEELTSPDKDKVYKKIFQFLEVDDLPLDFNIKSNTAKKVKNPLIQKLLTSSPWMSSLTKKLLPDADKRKRLRKKMKSLNQTAYTNKANKLSPELKQLLIKDYYLEDIKLLETLIDKDVSHWYKSEER